MKKYLLQYPFLTVDGFQKATYIMDGGCWLEDIPDGWHAEVLEMCDKIKTCLRANNLAPTDFVIDQMKEKFGHLRLYFHMKEQNHLTQNVAEQIQKIIDHYEFSTGFVCVRCGKPGMMRFTGWTHPACNDCEPQPLS